MQRGGCPFAEKAAFAEANGAVATIISNNAPGNFFGTLGTYFPSGPSVSISQADGATLAAEIAGATTTANVGVVRDNAIEYWLISGTSFSGPTVAGVAALVLDANPTLTADEVRHLLVNTAEPIGHQNIFGAGMVQADDAVSAALP
jgi:subtilisin family serine protease